MSKQFIQLATGVAVTTLFSAAASAALVTFDEASLTLAPDSYYAPGTTTSFTSGGVNFDHLWSFSCCWSGVTYSNSQDTTTAGFTNDRSAFTGDGAGAGQDNYAIQTNLTGTEIIDFGQSVILNSFDVTNTTYAYLAIKFGDDGNETPYVKGPFQDATESTPADFFRVVVNGLDASNSIISSTQFSLAEGSSVLDTWMNVDLSVLGQVNGLSFEYLSSDTSGSFLNTPAYFAFDNLDYQAVPLPAAAWFFASALGLLTTARRHTA